MATVGGARHESRLRSKMKECMAGVDCSSLVYSFTPHDFPEGLVVHLGERPTGHQTRQVVTQSSRDGHLELQWTGDGLDPEAARALLTELDALRKGRELNWVVDYLHGSICQTMTAAHLHLELGLLDEEKPDSEYETARKLLHQSMVALREFIDELSK